MERERSKTWLAVGMNLASTMENGGGETGTIVLLATTTMQMSDIF